VKPVVGVLGVQGDVEEHLRALAAAGAEPRSVKSVAELAPVEGLVIPGGESTTVIRLLKRFGLDAPIRERVRAGMPLWGTCMGLIVAAHDVADLNQETLDLIDVTVRRNAYGRQVASSEVPLAIPALGPEPFPAIFIRAPWIERSGPEVEVLAEHGGHGVFVREKNVLGTSFHPELTGDARVHEYFLDMVRASAAAKKEKASPN
jgi:5'-phosphate synthase pdxT subunit